MLEHNADWVTDYLTLPVAEGGMGIDQGLVVISFSVCSLTGPTLGVFFGGWIIDRQGGYKCDTGKAAMDTLQTCSYFGIGAVGCALPTAFGTNYWFIMTTMWFVLFFGGALLSPCTGVCINSVHPDLRSFSSALSMFAYNILGYAAAPFACGVVGERSSLGACRAVGPQQVSQWEDGGGRMQARGILMRGGDPPRGICLTFFGQAAGLTAP